MQDNVYETDDALNMYLGLHYPLSGSDVGVDPIIPHSHAPLHSIGFPQRVAQLLVSLMDYSSGGGSSKSDSNNNNNTSSKSRALDMGCAVGGSSFELAKSFDCVDAFDFSQSFIDAAKRMQDPAIDVRFRVPVEAELFDEVVAKLFLEEGDRLSPEDDEKFRSRVNFFTGDACKLEEMSHSGRITTAYDGVIMSNLLCRLPHPKACLDGLNGIMNMGGVVVLVTPYSWLTEFTPKSDWLGGFYDASSSEAIQSKDVLKEVMEANGFEKIHESQMPLMIREHKRKYQYIVSEATGWRKIA